MKMMGNARLGRDAEVRFTNDGTPVAGLALAVDWGKKDQSTGDRPTQWIEASFWGARAEALAPYLTKGSVHCFYLSEVHIETYQKNDGGQGVKLSARVDDVDLGARPAGQGHQQPAQQRQQAAPARSSERNAYADQKGNGRTPPQSQAQRDDFSDDVPF